MKNKLALSRWRRNGPGVFGVIVLMASLFILPNAWATSHNTASTIHRPEATSCMCQKPLIPSLALNYGFCWPNLSATAKNDNPASDNPIDVVTHSLRVGINWVTNISNMIESELALAPMRGSTK